MAGPESGETSILKEKDRPHAHAGLGFLAGDRAFKIKRAVRFPAAAREAPVPFCGLFLKADLPTRIARISARADDASDADAQVAAHQKNYRLDHLDWNEIDASGSPAQTLVKAKDVIGTGE